MLLQKSVFRVANQVVSVGMEGSRAGWNAEKYDR